MTSFMDKAKKAISNTTNTVTDTAKSSANNMKQNNIVNEEQKKIKAAYLSIGEKYAQLHPSDYEPEYAEFFEQIHTSETAIEVAKETIRRNKGLVLCANCGAEISETSPYCTNCGAKNTAGEKVLAERAAAEAAAEAASKCPVCGAPRTPGAAFCPSCGNKFDDGDTPAAEAQTNGIVCPTCGKIVPEGYKFCTSCGTKVIDD